MQSFSLPPRLASSILAVTFKFLSIEKIVWVSAFSMSREYRHVHGYKYICQQDSVDNEKGGRNFRRFLQVAFEIKICF